jgi:dTDP-4-amino-4,6-dideoxygalactose transaminase
MKNIPVNKPFMPKLDEYQRLIAEIWERRWLTNHGPLVTSLEQKISAYTELPHFFFLNNGTIAIQIAIKALKLRGEIITTPFSYVATTSSIVWEDCIPVFADIDPHSWNISPDSIREKITPRTTAIIATHVYGNPCDVEVIDTIAREHGLKVIYDAAHAFGVIHKGKSLFHYGDVSTVSFHATKLFHTVEGGGVFCKDPDVAHNVSYMRNFGHNGQEAFWGVGVNGKNSEVHAAMGHCNFPHLPSILSRRGAISAQYNEQLTPLYSAGLLRQPTIAADTVYNHAYYPILLNSESELLRVRDALHEKGIVPRRYFYPSLALLPYVEHAHVPVALDYSPRVLCLPSYHDLSEDDISYITECLLGLVPDINTGISA